MKLYDGGRAPNPRRVTVFIAEKGITIERVAVDMGAMGHKSAENEKRNPLRQLPVLELEDGTFLSESVAICRYLERLHPEPDLMGRTPLEEAQIEMWQRRVELHLFYPVAQAFRHLHPAMKDWETPQVPEWGEVNKPKALATMAFLDGELARRAFIAGDRYTIADITAMVALDFTKPARITIPEDFRHLHRWYEQVRARPGSAL